MSETKNKFLLQKGTILCANRKDFCFSLWRTDQNGSVVIVRQGCWQTERPETCQNNRCISDKPKSSTKSHRFCCCSDDMCNSNITTTEYAEVNDFRTIEKFSEIFLSKIIYKFSGAINTRSIY